MANTWADMYMYLLFLFPLLLPPSIHLLFKNLVSSVSDSAVCSPPSPVCVSLCSQQIEKNHSSTGKCMNVESMRLKLLICACKTNTLSVDRKRQKLASPGTLHEKLQTDSRIHFGMEIHISNKQNAFHIQHAYIFKKNRVFERHGQCCVF